MTQPQPPQPTAGKRWRRHSWILVPVILFFVYSTSFNSFPAVEREISVVGDADAASYIVLLKGFALGTKPGNEYEREHRTPADIAQKHKLHHVLSAATGHLLYGVFSPAYGVLGLPKERAVYSVAAVFACVNLVLLYLLMRGANPNGNPLVPFLVFYGLSLNTWLYASVPDSWPLTTALFLTFVILLRRRSLPLPGLAALLGFFMLNNMTLGAALLLLWLQLWRESPMGPRLLVRAATLSLITVAVWLGGLSLLSLFDPGFRPDRFMAYSGWFRNYMGAQLPLTSAYVWKSIFTNLFVNSLLTNQGNTNVAQEALLLTIRGSRLGLVAVLAVLTLLGVGFGRALRYHLARWRATHSLREVLGDPDLQAPLYCGVMVLVTAGLYYAGGFTYSAIVVPLIAMTLCRHLDMRVTAQRILVYGAVALLVVNNVDQVLQFRATLAAMH